MKIRVACRTGIEIVDESTSEELRYVLLIDQAPKATLTKRAGIVELHLQVYGPLYFPEAEQLIHGLFELNLWASKIKGESTYVKRNRSMV